MKISTRAKFIYGAVLFIVIGMAIIVEAVESHAQIKSPIVIIFFAWVFIGSWGLTKICCSNCGTSVAYQGKLGNLSIYTGFVRSNCQNCGHSLTAVDGEH